jgi:hypothetical protein
MKAPSSPFRGSRFLVPAIVLLFVAFLAINALPLKKSKQDEVKREEIKQKLSGLKESIKIEDLKLTNQTSSFTVVGMEKTQHGDIRISLRNDYAKRITAYEISIGSTTTLLDTALSTHDESIAPGVVKEDILSIDIDPDLQARGIVIHAVVFDDGTSDGNPDSIKEIEDYRLGEKMQLDHTLRLLDAALNVPDEEVLGAISTAQANLLASSAKSESALPTWVKFGISDTEKRISHYIDNIKQKHDRDTKNKITQLIQYSRQKAAELTTYLQNSGAESRTRSREKTLQ